VSPLILTRERRLDGRKKAQESQKKEVELRLLMGVMFTQRPDLFKAVVCQVPLLDMKRYNRLLAGASWMDEYGNPDVPEDWAFIRNYSPYQNVSKAKKYPRILFTTSACDDRVHPDHARKMVAKMNKQGHDVLYYENVEGGHGGAANNEQRAYMSALAYSFLIKELWQIGNWLPSLSGIADHQI